MLKLYKKIDAVQKEIGSLRKDGKNPHFGNTYVTKDSLLDQIRPYFEKHNLLLIQPPQADKLETRIICLSGKKAFLKNNTQDYANVVDYINTDPKASIAKLKIRFAMTKEMEDQLTKLINLNNK